MRVFLFVLGWVVGLSWTGAGLRAEELRLVLRQDGGEAPAVSTDGADIFVSRDGESGRAEGGEWSIVGDLVANAQLIAWAPTYVLQRRPDQPKGSPHRMGDWFARVSVTQTERSKYERFSFLGAWPGGNPRPAVLVLGWLVGERLTRLAVRPVRPYDPAHVFARTVEFDLTPDEASGQSVVLLWSEGRFVPPAPEMPTEKLQSVLREIMFGRPDFGGLSEKEVDTAGRDGRTLLYFAAEAGKAHAIESLRRARGKSEWKAGRRHFSALVRAAANGRIESVRRLLRAGADKNAVEHPEGAALNAATMGGHVDVVNALLNVDADVEIENDYGFQSFTEAVLRGHIDAVQAFQRYQPDILSPDAPIEWQLSVAAAGGRRKLVEFLLGHVKKPKRAKKPITWRPSAVVAAARGGDLELLKVLLDAGRHIDDIGEEGVTALMASAETGNLEIFKWLMEQKANLHVCSDSGRTVAHFAAQGGDLAIVKMLAAAEADLDQPDRYGVRPIDTASQFGKTLVYNFLVARGAHHNPSMILSPLLERVPGSVIYEASSVDLPPRVAGSEDYPEGLWIPGYWFSGGVIIEATVGADGSLLGSRILLSSTTFGDRGFAASKYDIRSAREWIEKQKFYPAMLNDVPVAARMVGSVSLLVRSGGALRASLCFRR